MNIRLIHSFGIVLRKDSSDLQTKHSLSDLKCKCHMCCTFDYIRLITIWTGWSCGRVKEYFLAIWKLFLSRTFFGWSAVRCCFSQLFEWSTTTCYNRGGLPGVRKSSNVSVRKAFVISFSKAIIVNIRKMLIIFYWKHSMHITVLQIYIFFFYYLHHIIIVVSVAIINGIIHFATFLNVAPAPMCI